MSEETNSLGLCIAINTYNEDGSVKIKTEIIDSSHKVVKTFYY